MSVIFGEKLKDLRNELGITQDDAAISLNIKRSRLASYEEGTTKPDIEMLIKLMDFYYIDNVRDMVSTAKEIHVRDNDFVAKNSLEYKYRKLHKPMKKVVDFILNQRL
jgi:transcriptional regulator with XRE-family HTH domain